MQSTQDGPSNNWGALPQLQLRDASTGTWRRLVRWKPTEVSIEFIFSITMREELTNSETNKTLAAAADEADMLLWNVGWTTRLYISEDRTLYGLGMRARETWENKNNHVLSETTT